MIKKILALLLVLVSVCSFIACEDKDNKKPENNGGVIEGPMVDWDTEIEFD